MADSSTFLVRTARWTAVLLALAVGISWVLAGAEMALGVALGCVVGLGNLMVLSRTLTPLLERPEEHRPAAGKKWVLPTVMVLKWPFVLLALGLILWYMPARLEGVAIGVALSLIAASVAAIRAPTTSPAPNANRTP